MATITPHAANHDRLDPLASRYVRVDELPWTPTPFPGIDIKVLLEDEETGLLTALTRLRPGAVLPLHEHTGLEQTWVLAGCGKNRPARVKGETPRPMPAEGSRNLLMLRQPPFGGRPSGTPLLLRRGFFRSLLERFAGGFRAAMLVSSPSPDVIRGSTRRSRIRPELLDARLKAGHDSPPKRLANRSSRLRRPRTSLGRSDPVHHRSRRRSRPQCQSTAAIGSVRINPCRMCESKQSGKITSTGLKCLLLKLLHHLKTSLA